MAGKSRKKDQNNPDKESIEKKQSIQKQRNPVKSRVHTDDSLIKPEASVPNPEKRTKKVIKNSDKRKAETEKVHEDDIAGKVQKVQQAKSAETSKTELVVFHVDEEEFAFRLSNIREIIRVPSITKVPNVPQYITGLCSLRGDLLPVIDSRRLFGMPAKECNESSRIIVADIHGKMVGLISDKVSEVINIDEAAIKEPPTSLKGTDGGVIQGILILNDGKRVVMVLDAEKVIKTGNLNEVTNQQFAYTEKSSALNMEEDEEEQIVIFHLGSGEYAFNIDCVEEIIRLPDVRKAPNTADYIEGVFSLRNQLLAVVHPGKILGIHCKQPDEYGRVIIIDSGSFSYGVIVDKVSHVARVQKKLFKENSRLANCSSAGFVKGFFSLDDGKRLVMMLDPHKLLRIDDVKAVLDVQNNESVSIKANDAGETDSHQEYVVFKLGDEEYGIEINHVKEVNRVNEITGFPGAPAFITGMVDFRGEVIPILNLRSLFATDDSDQINISKFLVVEFHDMKIGILIDTVSEVRRLSTSGIEEAPDVFRGKEQDQYIDKIAKLNDGKRIVLLLDLSRLFYFL